VKAGKNRQALGNWIDVLGGSDGFHSHVIPTVAKRFEGRQDVIGLSTVRIPPEPFQHKHETMDTLAK
jgi:hypothetical protein